MEETGRLVLDILLAVYLSHFLLREALISPQPPTLLRGLLEDALRTESLRESHRCSGLLGEAASVPWWQVEKGIWYQTVVSITWGFHLEFRKIPPSTFYAISHLRMRRCDEARLSECFV